MTPAGPWVRFFDVFGMATFFLMAALSFAFLIDFLIAKFHTDTPGTTEWIGVWSGLTVLFTFVGIGRLERVSDFWIGGDLSRWQQLFQWVPNCVVISAMWRLYKRNHFGPEK